jgi:hypothetical protein
LVPQLSLQMFFSTGTYDNSMLRMLGIMLIALGIVILQIIRHRAEAFYPTTLGVRIPILVVMIYLYTVSADPLYLILSVMVGSCYLITLTSFLLDRSRQKEIGCAQLLAQPLEKILLLRSNLVRILSRNYKR